MRLAYLLVRAALVVSFAGPISAADARPLRLTLRSPTGRPRSQAPQTLELTLSSQVESLLEGELEVSIYAGRRLIQKYRSDPLVLGTDPLQYRLMIPPIALHNDQTRVTALGRFITSRETYELDEQDVVVAPQWKRWFVLAISRPEEEVVYRDRFSIELALSPERFNLSRGDLTDLLTTPAVISPAALPATSAGYSSFDVLVLEGGGFSQLRDGQLTALAAWVEAGGSVVVRPTGVLKAGHLAFLNRMASTNTEEPHYVLDERGRIDPASQALAASVARYYSGLGRTVVLHQPRSSDEDFSTDDWIETAMFVWKIRADQRSNIRSTGKWETFIASQGADVIDGPRPFAPQERPLESSLRELLIPEKVQGLPFWVVVAILAVFLLLIAPGDYFLLGALRARRLTWVSLTAMSLLFTVGTVRITERVMGTTDYRRAVVFADLGRDGRPLKTSRYELLFTATQKTIASRFQNEMYVRIDDRLTRPAVGMPDAYIGPHGLAEDESSPQFDRDGDLPEYVGKLPADYVIHQQMRQWSPRVNRQTSLGGSFDIPHLDWEALARFPWDRAAGRRELRETIRKSEPQARVFLFHGAQMYDLAFEQEPQAMPQLAAPGPDPLMEDPEDGDPVGFGITETGIADAVPVGAFQNARIVSLGNVGQVRDPLVDLIRRASVAAPQGLFSVISQMAPTGGDSLEDLALVDPSDDHQWLLVIVISRGDDRVVFRKLYRRGG